ncbi:hypothetical protein SAMD00023353_0100210 [Rosellinia necatrix]|uniref:Uncharacterized protein n=1 Tax=Rosellinia necatrix TaxID=77044 RepID=A0A1S7UHX9_ROSNE|nr:hypothetical protein SAMD00023353_0100210 [Rosellinia necatrix]
MPALSLILNAAQPLHPRRLASPRLPRYRIPTLGSGSVGALEPRAYDDATTVPEGYGHTPFGPGPGTVAGIVLGSVAGFLLVLALVYWFVSLGQGPRREEGSIVGGGGGTESVVSWRTRPSGPPRKPHRRSRHSARREKVEVRRTRPPPPTRVVLEREDEIVVEEYRSRSRSRPRAARNASPSPPRPAGSVLSAGDDVIIVEEDHHSPPPPRRRRDSERSHNTGLTDDRRGTYRREDIYARDASRRRSSSRA